MSDTTAPPVSIVEFITARLDEDEAAANSRTRMATGPAETCVVGGQELTAAWSVFESDPDRRALADVRAKRVIMELHKPVPAESCHCGQTHGFPMCGECYSSTASPDVDGSIPCATLRGLASVYADHPNYRQEWRYE